MAQLFKMAFSGVGKSLAKTAPMRFLCRSNDLRMKELGLLYEDILIDTPAVKRAIERLPADEQQARWRRIKRAIDLDLKHKTLPPEQWVDPRESYLAEHLADVERLEAERASMDMD